MIEIEAIAEEKDINYPNLTHVFGKLCNVWNEHEEKEEKIFPILEEEKIKIPVEAMLCEHKEIRKHKNAIKKAIKSGSNFEMKKMLEKDGIIIIEKIKIILKMRMKFFTL